MKFQDAIGYTASTLATQLGGAASAQAQVWQNRLMVNWVKRKEASLFIQGLQTGKPSFTYLLTDTEKAALSAFYNSQVANINFTDYNLSISNDKLDFDVDCLAIHLKLQKYLLFKWNFMPFLNGSDLLYGALPNRERDILTMEANSERYTLETGYKRAMQGSALIDLSGVDISVIKLDYDKIAVGKFITDRIADLTPKTIKPVVPSVTIQTTAGPVKNTSGDIFGENF